MCKEFLFANWLKVYKPLLIHLLLTHSFGSVQFPKNTLCCSFGLGALAVPHTSDSFLPRSKVIRSIYK